MGRSFPKTLPLLVRWSGPPSNTWFLGTTRVLIPSGILIGSTIFAGLTSVTDRQTDHAARSVTVGRVCVRSTAMRHNNNSTMHRMVMLSNAGKECTNFVNADLAPSGRSKPWSCHKASNLKLHKTTKAHLNAGYKAKVIQHYSLSNVTYSRPYKTSVSPNKNSNTRHRASIQQSLTFRVRRYADIAKKPVHRLQIRPTVHN